MPDNPDELRADELRDRPKYKRPCTGFCEGCSPRLGGCEDKDNFEEDEADASEMVPLS
jgi:hypothetical protein